MRLLRHLLVAVALCLSVPAYADTVGISPPIPLASPPWTPNIAFGGSSTGVTGTFTGQYRIVNALLCYGGRILLTNNGSGTGAATITGFPVPASSAVGSYGTVNFAYWTLTTGVVGNIVGLIQPSATTATVYISGATGVAPATETNITDTTELLFSGCYPI